jgi:hypothetical protein
MLQGMKRGRAECRPERVNYAAMQRISQVWCCGIWGSSLLEALWGLGCVDLNTKSVPSAERPERF